MSSPFAGVDRSSQMTPLGMRFHDALSNTFVGEGLHVSAYPPSRPGLRRAASVNRSAIYVLQDLPGLGDPEHGAGDGAPWSSS